MNVTEIQDGIVEELVAVTKEAPPLLMFSGQTWYELHNPDAIVIFEEPYQRPYKFTGSQPYRVPAEQPHTYFTEEDVTTMTRFRRESTTLIENS